MEPEKVQQLYGGEYAEKYNTYWQHHPIWAPEAGHYVRSIGELIGEGTRWLDVGCGTGWFLSQFPDVERGGIDLSPGMLAQAEKANPDALFLRQGDIRDDIPEWHDQWDLVTSTGQAWGYVDTIDHVRQVADNMAAWTSPEGVLMVQPGDIFDLTGLQIDYDFHGAPQPNGTTKITGAIWNFYDEGGVHENQIWPSVDVWVRWLAVHFGRIEIVIWPHDPPFPYLFGGRRLVLASRKRKPGDETPAEIIVHPVPEADRPPVAEPTPEPEPEPLPEPEPEPEPTVPVEPEVYVHPRDHAEPGLPAGRLPGRGLYDQPLSYLVARFAPWKPAFWRSATRRAKKLRS
jgi:SAM-dependent methyltransferase